MRNANPISRPTVMIGLDELARELGIPPERLKRIWPRLHRDHGLPRKHPCGWSWPRALTTAWLLSQNGVPVGDTTNDNHPDRAADAHRAQVEAQRAALHQRYGGRA
ncbi:MAG: hypothetical protein CMN87_18340 [Stappia sp.]|uniref:hypothetical protein n=1 Tax=Stappia sp. TaxID=1870903 RepID=UPI000C3AB37C|nr:hypothetical protein [Stappia sp.]MAA97431.1 hypothetical protein [Stappia sp.]MBM21964.1 hypothetical protein [Stappia sp.]|tara:strand:+ start:687 stop:1004 length:318 start_codon:yes stop_codon:yes gene_type:complete